MAKVKIVDDQARIIGLEEMGGGSGSSVPVVMINVTFDDNNRYTTCTQEEYDKLVQAYDTSLVIYNYTNPDSQYLSDFATRGIIYKDKDNHFNCLPSDNIHVVS